MEIGHTTEWFKDNADCFDEWWDADEFDWLELSDYLTIYCGEHIKKWWDAEKFNWYADASYYLMEYCSKDFELWWNSNKYEWRYDNELVVHCWAYRHIWGQHREGREILFHHLRGHSGFIKGIDYEHGFLPVVKVTDE